MFNRVEYKKSALSSLRNNWFIPCLLAIVYSVLSLLSKMAVPIVGVCVSAILIVGISFTFMKIISAPDEKISFDTFVQSLEDRWIVSIFGGLWNFLWIFLWSLLFMIPGIIKYYSYSMMFYVLAENPKVGPMKAMEISKILTRNHKSDLFVMDLSFLGWTILSLFSCGIGFIWLFPYVMMAKTYAYYDLKRMALSQGILTLADFEV